MSESSLIEFSFFALTRESANPEIPSIRGANIHLQTLAQQAEDAGFKIKFENRHERLEKQAFEYLNNDDEDKKIDRHNDDHDSVEGVEYNALPPNGVSDWLTFLTVYCGPPAAIALFVRNIIGTWADALKIQNEKGLSLTARFRGKDYVITNQKELEVFQRTLEEHYKSEIDDLTGNDGRTVVVKSEN